MKKVPVEITLTYLLFFRAFEIIFISAASFASKLSFRSFSSEHIGHIESDLNRGSPPYMLNKMPAACDDTHFICMGLYGLTFECSHMKCVLSIGGTIFDSGFNHPRNQSVEIYSKSAPRNSNRNTLDGETEMMSFKNSKPVCSTLCCLKN